jgi:adenine-specific DNA-methyltransferase
LFKPLYYLGCKASISSTIRDAIDSVDSSRGRACDLFAGSGAVAAALSRSRSVTAVDVQEYARVVCAAQLNPAATSRELALVADEVAGSELFKQLQYCLADLIALEKEAAISAKAGEFDDITALIETKPILFSAAEQGRGRLVSARKMACARLVDAGLWRNADSTVCRYFGGVYFSYHQAAYLDAALCHASRQHGQKRNTLLSAVLSTASAMVNTVGKQFAQPIRPRDKAGRVKYSLVSSAVRDRDIDVRALHEEWLAEYGSLTGTNRRHEAIRGDYLDVLSRKGRDFSVLYADPPYTRDHYSRFYHVLETMCLRDEPEVTTTNRNGQREPSRGVYRENRHQSPFCVRSMAPSAFEALFKEARRFSLPLVLSYSPSEEGDGTHPRVVSASQIVSIARSSYGSVDVHYLNSKRHNKHNRIELDLANRPHAEMLLICRP